MTRYQRQQLAESWMMVDSIIHTSIFADDWTWITKPAFRYPPVPTRKSSVEFYIETGEYTEISLSGAVSRFQDVFVVGVGGVTGIPLYTRNESAAWTLVDFAMRDQPDLQFSLSTIKRPRTDGVMVNQWCAIYPGHLRLNPLLEQTWEERSTAIALASAVFLGVDFDLINRCFTRTDGGELL